MIAVISIDPIGPLMSISQRRACAVMNVN